MTCVSEDLATRQTASVSAAEKLPQRLVLLGGNRGPAGRPEGDQGGRPERELGRRPLEELGVLGVGPRPPALDEGDAQMVELLGHPELVVDGQRQTLLLRAVAQGGVEDVHRLGQGGEVEVVAGSVGRVLFGPSGTPVGMGKLSGGGLMRVRMCMRAGTVVVARYSGRVTHQAQPSRRPGSAPQPT